jgi:acetyl esterase/lipase
MAALLNIDPAVFDPASISQDTHDFNAKLQDIMNKGPKWYEVGAPKYRQMRAAGETPLPAATYLDSAEDFDIPSRESGRGIPCRVLRPQKGDVKGVFMHIHGGGWVLQDQKSQDPVLQDIANRLGLVCVSVGYRLAPEDPFPAGPEDCYDAAEWLVLNAEKTYGQPLKFVGGESAGGHLSMLVALHLLQHSDAKFSGFQFKGLLLHFGAYSMAWQPTVYTFNPDPILVLNKDLMDHYVDVFLPNYTEEQKRDPKVSPLFTDLEKLRGKLPSALFTCGTYDCLLDDTIFMASKWGMSGGETLVKIVPGAPHGYIMFPTTMKGSGADVGMEAVDSFVKSKMS